MPRVLVRLPFEHDSDDLTLPIHYTWLAMRSPDPVLANDAYEYGQKQDEQAQRGL